MAWRVRLICCSRDAGDIFRDTWEEADEFRQSYTSSGVGYPRRPFEGGHVRAGIIEQIGGEPDAAILAIDPDCLACAACGELIGHGPYALTASNAVVHPKCANTATNRPTEE